MLTVVLSVGVTMVNLAIGAIVGWRLRAAVGDGASSKHKDEPSNHGERLDRVLAGTTRLHDRFDDFRDTTVDAHAKLDAITAAVASLRSAGELTPAKEAAAPSTNDGDPSPVDSYLRDLAEARERLAVLSEQGLRTVTADIAKQLADGTQHVLELFADDEDGAANSAALSQDDFYQRLAQLESSTNNLADATATADSADADDLLAMVQTEVTRLQAALEPWSTSDVLAGT